MDGPKLIAAKAGNVGRAILCAIMFFVYPLESFVARHVIMTNIFQGREAHEGDDHAVLDRWDRRVLVTILLYTSVLIPALNYSDVGLILSLTGTIAATSLAYLLPGSLFIGVHGEEFLDLVESNWGYSSLPDTSNDNYPGAASSLLWYILMMPVWCWIAASGKRGIASHKRAKELQTPAHRYRLGKIKHKYDTRQQRRMSEVIDEEDSESDLSFVKDKRVESIVMSKSQGYGAMESMTSCVEEEDPQDEKATGYDFAVAAGFTVFGIVAFASGILSLCATGG